jgi:nitrate reductase gamma subunit
MSLRLTDFYPVWFIDLAAAVTLAIIAAGVAYRVRELRRIGVFTLLAEAARRLGPTALASTILSELFSRVVMSRDVITDSKWRWSAHYSQFAGFILCAIATTLVYIYYPTAEPRQFTDIPKIIGNIGGILLVVGGLYFLLRLSKWSRRPVDTVFTALLFTVAVTGFGTQISRVSGDPSVTFWIYTAHLVSVAALLASAPFTRFFHVVQTPLMRLSERLYVLASVKSGAVTVLKQYPGGTRSFKEEMMVENLLEKYRGYS